MMKAFINGLEVQELESKKGDSIMNLKPIRANMTEVDLGRYRVLFSYKTPVALFDRELNRYQKTEKYWSRTTSRHINQWLNGNTAIETDQDFFDNLVK